MDDMPYIAEVAALIGDPARANILCALKNKGGLSATELGHVAGVAASTASGHLARLTDGQLLNVERCGRSRIYRLASPLVADAIEALEALAVNTADRSVSERRQDAAIRLARSCYDHLGGKLGVELANAMMRLGLVEERENGLHLADRDPDAFHLVGIDIEALKRRRRKQVIACADWTEREPHLGGALGAELFAHFLSQGWLRRVPGSRAVALTPIGREALRTRFRIELSLESRQGGQLK
jgi:DNA-binding transcriptional ArsR family regulator